MDILSIPVQNVILNGEEEEGNCYGTARKQRLAVGYSVCLSFDLQAKIARKHATLPRGQGQRICEKLPSNFSQKQSKNNDEYGVYIFVRFLLCHCYFSS